MRITFLWQTVAVVPISFLREIIQQQQAGEGMSGKITTQAVRELRARIDALLTNLSHTAKWKKSRVLAFVADLAEEHPDLGARFDLTDDQLRYWVDQGLVRPEVVKNGGRDTHLYGRDQVCTILLIYTLRVIHELSYAQIANLLRDVSDSPPRLGHPPTLTTGEAAPSQQSMRGLTLLRTRMLATFLNTIFDGSIPINIVIHLRRQRVAIALPQTTDPVRLESTWVKFVEADRQVGDFRSDDILAWVTDEREVLFVGLHAQNLVALAQRGYQHWLVLTIHDRAAACSYQLVIGLVDQLPVFIDWPQNAHERATLTLLLHTLFAQLVIPSPAQRSLGDGGHPVATPLQTLTELVPQLFPQWDYCAILTPTLKNPAQLQILSTSAGFPSTVRSHSAAWAGQMLLRWVYQRDLPMIISHTCGVDDPRLAFHSPEHPSAAAAFPTHEQGQLNGVLYVGAQRQSTNEGFTPPELCLLTMLADLIGETIGRSQARAEAEQSAARAIRRPVIAPRSWEEIKGMVNQALDQLAAHPEAPSDRQALQFVALQIKLPEGVRRAYPQLPAWVREHIVSAVEHFFARRSYPTPEIFIRKSEMPSELVCFFPNVEVAEGAARGQRDELRKLLGSIKLSVAAPEDTPIAVHVWILPFRLRLLYQKLRSPGKQRQTVLNELMSRLEAGMDTLSYVEAGHEYERQGNFPAALEQYLIARRIAHNKYYILRRIANCHAAKGDYASSIRYWEELVAMEPHAKHYRDYAATLARAGHFSEAERYFAQAHQMNPHDVNTLIEWGDLLLAQAKALPALAHYEKAITLEEGNLSRLWLRIAEAHWSSNELEGASTYANLVLQKNPKDQEARRLMLKIVRAKQEAAG